MRKTERPKDNNVGVYAVYYNLKEDKNGYEMEHMVIPGSEKTPDTVKLAILQALLDDFNVPFRIDERMMKKGKR